MKFQICLVVAFCILVNHRTFAQDAKLSCIQCDSSKDENCIKDPSKIAPTECANAGEICSVTKNATAIIRGCVKEDECNDNCKSCQDKGCNTHLICKKCNSSDDPECAQKVNNKADQNTICDVGAHCSVQITDKNTVRDCLAKDNVATCSNNNETCHACNTANCNDQIFPANRRICHVCTDCAQPKDDIPCAVYEKDASCYIYGTESTKLQRGCVADKDAKCQKDGDENCFKCNSDKCNDREFERDQKRKCIKCDSSTDTNCSTPPSTDLKSCEKKLKFYQEDACFTQTQDKKTTRGCLYDVFNKTEECSDKNGCEICDKEDGCNNKSDAFTCYTCRSDKMKECWDKVEEVGLSLTAECEHKDKTDQGCYHFIDEGVAFRGCFADTDIQTQKQCELRKGCQCKEKNCNKEKSSGASSLIISCFFLFGLALLA